MIQKYLYGVPLTPNRWSHQSPASQANLWERSKPASPASLPALAEGDRVYGLGEANRGINKRGFVYVSDNVDDGLHTENKQRMYAAHNFIVISGQQNLGLFFDYPARIRFDIGFTRRIGWKSPVSGPTWPFTSSPARAPAMWSSSSGHHRPQLHPAQICLWV